MANTAAAPVAAMDASGNTVTSFTGAVAIAIDNNPVGGTLTGNAPVTAVMGVAPDSSLTLDQAGTGYTLKATSGTLTPATSNSFNITAAPPPPATHLAFGVQPRAAQVGATVIPPVRAAAVDTSGITATSFTRAVAIDNDNNPVIGTCTRHA